MKTGGIAFALRTRSYVVEWAGKMLNFFLEDLERSQDIISKKQ